MSDLYQSLVERMRGEVLDLDQIVERAGQGWTMVQQSSAEQFACMDSVALNLHGFYSGLERLFELIARHVDRKLPEGETWHRDLLQQMAEDLPDTPVRSLLAQKMLQPLMSFVGLDIWCEMCTPLIWRLKKWWA